MGLAVRNIELPAPASERLTWRSEFEVGDQVVDYQHRALYRSINRIFAMPATGRIGPLIELVDELIMEVMQHFRDEEGVLARAGCPGLEGHRRTHAKLVARMLTLRYGVQERTVPLPVLLDFLADELVDAHIRGEDRRAFGR